MAIFAHPVSAETPKYGGVLKIILNRSPLVFGDPAIIRGADYTSAFPAIEPLLRIDKMGSPQPRLITSWEVGPDRKAVTLFLRKGVRFHDGTNFDAKAVKYNLEARKRGKRGGLEKMTSIDVVDDYTVRLAVSRYDSTVLTQLAFAAGLMASPTAIEKNGREWAKTHPVGTGPFQFGKYKRAAYLKYTKFDGYWDKGKPYLDGLEFLYIKDPMTASAAFQAGEAHIFSRVKPEKTARELEAKGYKINSVVSGLSTLNGDTANPGSIYADKRVREAIEYAINRGSIAKALGYGFWEALNQLSPSVKYGYNPDLKGRPYNPEKAKELLTEAGYPNGFQTRIIVPTQFASRDAMVAVKRDLGKVGIVVKLDFVNRGKWYQHKYKGWKDCLMYLFAGVDPMFTQSLHRILSSSIPAYPSTLRPAGWDDFIDGALAADDFQIRKTLTQKAVRLATEEAMVIPLFGTQSVSALAKPVRADYYKIHHVQWSPVEA
jgi:peptide/nickel transport system substrate-binding protein